MNLNKEIKRITNPKLFFLLVGCRPKGRNTEQHDITFVIAGSIADTIPALKKFWPEVKDNMHIDCWREVTAVNGYKINVVLRDENKIDNENTSALFFINLGGYKEREFEEFHYKIIVVAKDKTEAIKQSKETAFYLHTGFKGAESHIDDKYGIDIDDIFNIEEILSDEDKKKYKILITPDNKVGEDELHLGFLPLSKIR